MEKYVSKYIEAKDIAISSYKVDGLGGLQWFVEVTHIPTGKSHSDSNTSQVKAYNECVARLEEDEILRLAEIGLKLIKEGKC